jgi:hypothetical protein
MKTEQSARAVRRAKGRPNRRVVRHSVLLRRGHGASVVVWMSETYVKSPVIALCTLYPGEISGPAQTILQAVLECGASLIMLLARGP